MTNPSIPTLSVILPNYNHAHYIGEALEAIAQQSFPPKEVIVVDDASTDNSMEVIELFVKRHPFVRLVRNERNQGVIYSCNLALKQCTGDFVLFAAADDKVLPGLFEKSLRLLSKHPQAGLCSTLGIIIDEHGQNKEPFNTPVISKTESFLPPEKVFRVFKDFGTWIVTHSAICSRAGLLEMGGLPIAWGPYCDQWLHAILTAKHGACFIPEPLVAWRVLGNSYGQTFARDLDKNVEMVKNVANDLRLKHGGLFPSEYVDAWERRSLLAQIYGLTLRAPYRYDQIVAMEQYISSATFADRVFFLTIRWCSKFARPLTKLYLFYNLPPKERSRIIRDKLKMTPEAERSQRISQKS